MWVTNVETISLDPPVAWSHVTAPTKNKLVWNEVAGTSLGKIWHTQCFVYPNN